MFRFTTAIPGVVSRVEEREFVHLYQDVFSGAPYHEQYSYEEVREGIWDKHVRDGRIVLVYDDYRLVGFGCALPFNKAPQDVVDFLCSCVDQGLLPADFTHEKVWYMSELGVHDSCRNRGLAYDIVYQRMLSASHARCKYYVMRTDAEESNSRHLYEQIGAKEIPRLHDVSDSEQVTLNESQSTTRVYLWGNCREGMQNAIDQHFKRRPEG